MYRLTIQPSTMLLLALLPLTGHAAPPPYWPGYPPPPYYYPPLPSAPASSETTPSLPPDGRQPPPPAGAAMKANTATDTALTESTAPEEPHEVGTDAIAPLNAADADNGTTAQMAADDQETSAAKSAVSSDAPDESLLEQEIATAIQQGNFAEAYYLWRPRAEHGNADAQYGIGWMYHNGYGLAISDDEAIAWWELAASQGHIDATFALGMLYGLGEGAVKRDMAQAVSYYHRAARAGHEDARLLLRTLMAEGDSSARQLMQTLLSEGQEGEVATPASVQSTKANIRKGPGTQHKVLTSLQQGHPLLPLKREGRWLLVGIKGKSYSGWVHDSLIDKGILSAP